MSNRRNLSIFFIVSILAISALLTGCSSSGAPEETGSIIVARVAGMEIKKDYYDDLFKIFKAQQEQAYGPEVWERDVEGRKFIDYAKEELLNNIIDETILLKKAADLGIAASQEQVNLEVQYIKQNFESEEKFNEYLASQNVTQELLMSDIRKRIITNNLANEISKSIEVPEDELKAVYESMKDYFFSVKASHILMENQDEAQKVLERAKSGEDFNKLAVEFSIDPSAQNNKGDLGYFTAGTMVPEFEEAAFALKPGQISDLVQTQYGYHIIKVEDTKVSTFEEVKDSLKQQILPSKQNEFLSNYFLDLKAKTEIVKYVENL